jgi:hypothetical protein
LDAAATSGQDSVGLYDAGCASALASQMESAADAQKEKYINRAIDLLTSAVAKGYTDGNHMSNDVELVSLHDDARFLALLSRLIPPDRYAAVWRADVQFESRLLTGGAWRLTGGGPKGDASPSVSHASPTTLQLLIAEGYRPVAIAGGR